MNNDETCKGIHVSRLCSGHGHHWYPGGDCKNDLKDLADKCQQFVKFPANLKIPPSTECCAAVQKADVPCVCSNVTPVIEKVVCMEKIVYVADYCNRPLKAGSKCGSYTDPGY
ncbi:hypothetical protein ACP4OV_019537 [Aristida adscensionis]